jgi:hypothetical protein
VGIYDPLQKYLANQHHSEIPITFAEVERVLHRSLPQSAFDHRPWWANEARGHVHAKAWLNAGYETTQVDMAGKKLVFKRMKSSSVVPSSARPAPGMEEPQSAFKSAEEKKPRRSPLFGALKGTFTIEPGWDLTNPMFDEDELAEMDANLERTAHMIEAGLSGKRK